MSVGEPLELGFSPCPNDCFIFFALAHGLVAHPPPRVHLADVEELNRLVLAGQLQASKISYHAYGHVADRYVMLSSGGALGKGVGPLVVTREPMDDLRGRSVAVPGGLTTANLLLRISQPQGLQLRQLRYDRIMPSVAAGEVDAGLIIHESRFTYRDHGLVLHLDLGEWWERTTGKLLPLGGIVASRSLGAKRIAELDRAICASLEYATAHIDEVEPYLARHAQEMSSEVRRKHVELYVNEYSRDLGDEGREAVSEMLARARERELIPAYDEERLFAL